MSMCMGEVNYSNAESHFCITEAHMMQYVYKNRARARNATLCYCTYSMVDDTDQAGQRTTLTHLGPMTASTRDESGLALMITCTTWKGTDYKSTSACSLEALHVSIYHKNRSHFTVLSMGTLLHGVTHWRSTNKNLQGAQCKEEKLKCPHGVHLELSPFHQLQNLIQHCPEVHSDPIGRIYTNGHNF